MGWWKRLKAWQKGGIVGVIVGSVHFIIYMTIFIFMPPIWVYVLAYMEWPWYGLLKLVGFQAVGTAKGLLILGLIGTILYAAAAMIVAWLFTVICRGLDRPQGAHK